jgi:hypothetical protein
LSAHSAEQIGVHQIKRKRQQTTTPRPTASPPCSAMWKKAKKPIFPRLKIMVSSAGTANTLSHTHSKASVHVLTAEQTLWVNAVLSRLNNQKYKDAQVFL